MTNAVFLGEPAPVGFGFSQYAIAGAYGTPIVSFWYHLIPQTHCDSTLAQVSVLLGELIGRYTNDWIMNRSIRRNNGVFEAESRLWYV